ncbi:MAG: hypothetical protein JNK38_04125 [Acidobacteria bacterium]|nr:hypothetical protein [Acidobacteriota bacterium]
MIKLRNVRLPATANAQLKIWQNEIDRLGNYADQVIAAHKKFKSRNHKDNKTFSQVRTALTRMCSGERRCCYCEDSQANQVEHIKPKSLYPEHVFVWSNYLYACAICNSPKNNRFAVFDSADNVVNVARQNTAPAAPPQPGEPVLINPRRENPTEWMQLDLLSTFWFVPIATPGSKEYKRVEYTIELLDLNRDLLPEARQRAFGDYRARLYEYIEKQKNGASTRQFSYLTKAIQTMPHPTVWFEMKRQHPAIKELNDLFTLAPEALNW